LIQKLYAIEKAIRHLSPEEKQLQRQQKSKPILNQIEKWILKSIEQVLPKSLLGKALHYMHKLWPKLTAYADSGYTEIDNNPAENAIRPFVLGRKNWLLSQSVKGAKSSAALYSVIETAKAHGLEPFKYLTLLFEKLPNVETIEGLEGLLPWHVVDDLS
jgi:transposase